jgi:hypothetical protein
MSIILSGGVFIMGIDAVVLAFAYKYLEYIVVGVGLVGGVIYMKSKHIVNHSNDLTSLIVKQKKYSESVNKRSKSSM